MKLPEYKCHKVVQAAKIVEITKYEVQTADDMVTANRMRLELPDDSELARYGYSRTVEVTNEWVERFNPQVGMYYVVYRDGYASVSPATEFEDGYAPVADVPITDPNRENRRRVIRPAPEADHIEVYSLKVTNRNGEVLLVLDEQGEVSRISPDLDVSNSVADRIVAAAVGGLDVRNIPENAEVVFLGHVQLDSVGWESHAGHWMKLQIPKDQFDEQLRKVDPDSLNIDLEVNMSTLQCLLIRGDLVHRQGEPSFSPENENAAVILRGCGIFKTTAMWRALCLVGDFDPEYDMEKHYVETRGYNFLEEVPPPVTVLWMRDHGLSDWLPDEFTQLALLSGDQWSTEELAGMAERGPLPLVINRIPTSGREIMQRYYDAKEPTIGQARGSDAQRIGQEISDAIMRDQVQSGQSNRVFMTHAQMREIFPRNDDEEEHIP